MGSGGDRAGAAGVSMSRRKLPLQLGSFEDNLAVLITRHMSVGEALRKFARVDKRVRREDLRTRKGDYMGMLSATLNPICATALVKEISRCGCSPANFRVAYEMMREQRLADKSVVAPLGNYTDLDGYEHCIMVVYNHDGEIELSVVEYDKILPAGTQLAVMRPY